jgi:hypothetical protein
VILKVLSKETLVPAANQTLLLQRVCEILHIGCMYLHIWTLTGGTITETDNVRLKPGIRPINPIGRKWSEMTLGGFDGLSVTIYPRLELNQRIMLSYVSFIAIVGVSGALLFQGVSILLRPLLLDHGS